MFNPPCLVYTIVSQMPNHHFEERLSIRLHYYYYYCYYHLLLVSYFLRLWKVLSRATEYIIIQLFTGCILLSMTRKLILKCKIGGAETISTIGWTKQDIWRHHLGLWGLVIGILSLFSDLPTKQINVFIEEITSRWINNENNRCIYMHTLHA